MIGYLLLAESLSQCARSTTRGTKRTQCVEACRRNYRSVEDSAGELRSPWQTARPSWWIPVDTIVSGRVRQAVVTTVSTPPAAPAASFVWVARRAMGYSFTVAARPAHTTPGDTRPTDQLPSQAVSTREGALIWLEPRQSRPPDSAPFFPRGGLSNRRSSHGPPGLHPPRYCRREPTSKGYPFTCVVMGQTMASPDLAL